MEVQSARKTIIYYESKPDLLTLSFVDFSQQEKSLHRDFLDLNYIQAENRLECQTGNLAELSTKKTRLLGGTLTSWLKKHQAADLCLTEKEMQQLFQSNQCQAFFEGLLMGGFSSEKYKQPKKSAWQLSIHVPRTFEDKNDCISTAQKYAAVMEIARTLGNEPANVINPVSLAEKCNQLAAQHGLTVKVLDEHTLRELGAGGILSVGQGSINKSRMIILEHSGRNPKEDPLVLVGKAITFDTGGYSLKSVEGIQGMKYDKLGGVAVIGFMLAAALLNLPQRFVGIICAAENMVSELAYRPDDIIKTLSGKTVEIITTDAEGRLVLADGLTYAQSEYSPKLIIDLATLTGGIVTALGDVRAGLFSNDDALSAKLFQAGETSDEKLWHMPLDDEYFDFIKGDYADLKNSGGRKGHPIMGGIFLKQFIHDDVPWAHIDIAGTSKNDKADALHPKGANGFGIRLLLEFVKNL